MNINQELEKYIVEFVFPQYIKNDEGHRIEHIKYVISRCFELSKDKSVNFDMLFTIAAYHDIGHHIDARNHEVVSAQMMFEDKNLRQFFNDEELEIMKGAIEDHRASLNREPRSIYGKIVSSADRNISVEDSLKRTYFYGKKHQPELNEEELIERSYNHLVQKFGTDGYANFFVEDEKYNKYLKDLRLLLSNKENFKCEILKIVSEIRKERAKQFAIEAHKGQVRKNEPDKPMITHPLSVGNLLEDFGYDDNVIAAGYLHDVVEDTKYTIEDIEKEFGSDVASLVMGASEPDKSLSWEERKKHTIEETKKLPLRNKLVICADKINNLEDLFLKFEKSGERDFSAFKRGEEQQRWYYTSIYESLVAGENKDLPIFARLKEVLDKVFHKKEDSFLKDIIFVDNRDYYAKLKQLHAMKIELQRLKSLCSLPKPFVIEFSGTPRTGKTTTINNLYDFFKKGGFKVELIEEFTTSRYYKENLKKKFDQMSLGDSNIAIIDEVYKQLQEALNSDKDIILVDRSLNDRQIWNYRKYAKGDMPAEQYFSTRDKYKEISKELIDFLLITYADPVVSLKRDYVSSLALEKRNFLSQDNIEEYNNCLNDLQDLFSQSVDSMLLLDTSSTGLNDVSVEATSQILPAMRKQYIKSFKQKYNLF